MARTVTTMGGATLTEADVDRLADRFEEGVDISGWKPRLGRPALDPGAQTHTPRIAVRVPGEIRRQAIDRAEREGRSLSAVVRELLEAYARGA